MHVGVAPEQVVERDRQTLLAGTQALDQGSQPPRSLAQELHARRQRVVGPFLQIEQLVERLPLGSVTLAEGALRFPLDVEIPRETVAAPACPRPFTLEVEGEVVQEPVDPAECEAPP